MVKKRSRTIIFIAIVTAIIIILAFIIFTNLGAQSSLAASPGVRKGDEFIYDIKGYWSSNDPDLTAPESVQELNMTDWYKVTVTNVDGAEITLGTIWHFSNGTELTGTGNVNVETGIHYPTDGFWAIYAANLKANDFVRPTGPDRSTINQTSTRDYASGTRETNRISLQLEYYDANDPTYSTTWTEYMNTQFDKQTGVLVELRDTSVYTNPDMTITLVWTIKDTNRWTVA
jgi:hypothetical protein